VYKLVLLSHLALPVDSTTGRRLHSILNSVHLQKSPIENNIKISHQRKNEQNIEQYLIRGKTNNLIGMVL